MRAYLFRVLVVCFLVALLPGTALLSVAASPGGGFASERVEAGPVLDFKAESPHPALDGWTDTYSFPGASFIRLHFKAFHLVEGDTLVVASPDGAQAWEYTGKGGTRTAISGRSPSTGIL